MTLSLTTPSIPNHFSLSHATFLQVLGTPCFRSGWGRWTAATLDMSLPLWKTHSLKWPLWILLCQFPRLDYRSQISFWWRKHANFGQGRESWSEVRWRPDCTFYLPTSWTQLPYFAEMDLLRWRSRIGRSRANQLPRYSFYTISVYYS